MFNEGDDTVDSDPILRGDASEADVVDQAIEVPDDEQRDE